jgi:predicted nucleic acid-binding Zn ribbon protein|tara:strand:- start:248 stop:400 length:153 start_codon:yes stop_codon:yes gene_type:complete
MINFCDEWECDGCGNIFDKTELVDSIQLPYYSCVDCEAELKKDLEEENDN